MVEMMGFGSRWRPPYNSRQLQHHCWLLMKQRLRLDNSNEWNQAHRPRYSRPRTRHWRPSSPLDAVQSASKFNIKNGWNQAHRPRRSRERPKFWRLRQAYSAIWSTSTIKIEVEILKIVKPTQPLDHSRRSRSRSNFWTFHRAYSKLFKSSFKALNS